MLTLKLNLLCCTTASINTLLCCFQTTFLQAVSPNSIFMQMHISILRRLIAVLSTKKSGIPVIRLSGFIGLWADTAKVFHCGILAFNTKA